LLITVFITDVVTLLLARMHYNVWIDLELHCLMFCLRSLRALCGSMPQKTFPFIRDNRLMCCANALWFVTLFLLLFF